MRAIPRAKVSEVDMKYIYADVSDGEPIVIRNVKEYKRDGKKRHIFVLENGKVVKIPASRITGVQLVKDTK